MRKRCRLHGRWPEHLSHCPYPECGRPLFYCVEGGEMSVEEVTEKEKVEAWRLHILLVEACYPLPVAERIAGSEADLHCAVELVKQGCPPETAARILL